MAIETNDPAGNPPFQFRWLLRGGGTMRPSNSSCDVQIRSTDGHEYWAHEMDIDFNGWRGEGEAEKIGI